MREVIELVQFEDGQYGLRKDFEGVYYFYDPYKCHWYAHSMGATGSRVRHTLEVITKAYSTYNDVGKVVKIKDKE